MAWALFLATRSARSTARLAPRPDFQWIHRCFYGNPPWVAHVIQRMFEKAAAVFLLAPEDTSFLFVVPFMHSAPWFHFTRSYQ